KPHTCSICSRRFSRPSSLRTHILTHTGERPHVCMICGRGFAVRSNLKRHGRVH
ncbi:MAG: hypothetical protein DHS80DRAFT_5397, partial [Piptocephalis tieghemiana]